VRAAELSEEGDHVFLPDFQSDAGTVGKLLHNLVVLRQNSLVYLQELLNIETVTSAEGRSSQNISAALI
jgi:hypothetical protein